MASMLLPETPGRGRSRFSKVLPLPPDATDPAPAPAQSPALSTISTPLYSPLPPIPASKLSLPPLPKAIPRKAIGMTAEQRALSAALAKASGSPMYSPSPVVSRITSDNSNSTMSSLSGQGSESATTPPTAPIPPRKDSRTQQTEVPEPVPLTSPTTTINALQNTPPELWKRRSVKSEKNLHFSELKLERSNGSTASPPRQEPPRQEPPRQEPPRQEPQRQEPLRQEPPKGPLPQVPQANNPPQSRKPVPISVPVETQPEFMGNKISKLKDKASRTPFHTSSSKDDSYQNGPPTPEDINGSSVNGGEKVVLDLPKLTSPRSPDTPPEESAPRIPVRSDSRNAISMLDKLLETDSTSTVPAPEIKHAHESKETLTIRSPQPRPADASRILSPQIPSPTEDKSSPLSSPVDDKSSSATRHSRQSSTIHFPTIPAPSLLPDDAILPGLPLTITHLDCYQSHKFMRGARNIVCPVACMVCAKRDAEMRWRCTWCCLSACGSCMQVLTSEEVGKDLRIALERVELQQQG